jgi:hypothetical protein
MPININVFTETEACTFIEKYTKTPADEHFKVLAKKMGYLPLALDQAGAYMEINKISFKDYLDLYKNYKLDLFADDDDDKKTVAKTWKISIDKINIPAANELLNLFAYFAPDNISKQWFLSARDILPDELREVAENDLKYNKAIAQLTKYSLITLQNDNISIHRLVQEVIRDNLKPNQSEWLNYCVKILNKLTYFDFSTAESRNLFLTLAPHVDAVTNEINDDYANQEELAKLFSFLAEGYNELADYKQALDWIEKALSIYEKVLGNEHPDTATTYNNIA